MIKGAKCLDLYAGSGIMGLEALSRGAGWVTFVDESRVATRTIEENLIKCGFLTSEPIFEPNFEVISTDAIKFVANNDGKYNVIFVDPFYNDHALKFLTKNLAEVIKKKGVIVFSHGKDLDVTELIADTDLKVAFSRRFGKAHIDFLTL